MSLTLKHRRTLSCKALRGDPWRGPVLTPRSTLPGLGQSIDHLRQTHCPVRWNRWAALRLAVYVASAAVAVLAIALVPSCVKAQPVDEAPPARATRLVATVGALHPDGEYAARWQLRDVTPGLGIERQLTDTVTGSVSYLPRNSHGRRSINLAAAWQPVTVLSVRAGLVAGLASGYPAFGQGRVTDFGPFAGAVLSAERGRLGGNLVLLPPVASQSGGAIALQITWRL